MKNKTFHYGLVQSSYWLSYLPLFAYATTFLLEMGFSNMTIGLLLAFSNLSSIALQSTLARSIDQGKYAMKTLMLSLALVILIMAFLVSLKPFLIFYYPLLVSLMSLQPFVNALGVTPSQGKFKLDFGLARGMASLIYSLSSFGLGALMTRLGISITPLAGILFILFHMICVASFDFPASPSHTTKERKNILGDYPFLLPFLVSVVLLFFGYSMFQNYLIHLVRLLGGSEASLGLALGISAFAEVPIMFSFTRISRRFKGRSLLRFSSLFFLIKALLDLMSRSMTMIYFNQSFNALTFGLFIPSAIFFISSNLDKKDTAMGQALLTSALIAGNVLASSVGGLVVDLLGIRSLLQLTLVIELLAFGLMILALKKREVTPL